MCIVEKVDQRGGKKRGRNGMDQKKGGMRTEGVANSHIKQFFSPPPIRNGAAKVQCGVWEWDGLREWEGLTQSLKWPIENGTAVRIGRA